MKCEDLREEPPNAANANNGRGWMRPEELAELEARLAAELRARRQAESEPR